MRRQEFVQPIIIIIVYSWLYRAFYLSTPAESHRERDLWIVMLHLLRDLRYMFFVRLLRRTHDTTRHDTTRQ